MPIVLQQVKPLAALPILAAIIITVIITVITVIITSHHPQSLVAAAVPTTVTTTGAQMVAEKPVMVERIINNVPSHLTQHLEQTHNLHSLIVWMTFLH
jgi:hypothetical protein